ncbi:MAG: efflux RND transporter periplasmic adaptor subunit [Chlamydiae bacterium]|nr:efflux RND transporter periplasmic adaptor subunit [Chlamydiota bacterium]MBI3266849.1 efflux RND transporter periplasmic adaptor subunit [Chlamydiota bacterium]
MNESTEESRKNALKSLVIQDSESTPLRTPSKPFPWKWVGVGFAVLVLAAAIGFLKRHRPLTVEVREVTVSHPYNHVPLLTGGGYLISKTQTVVGPKTSGRLKELLFEEGDKVKKGELLARLEDDELAAQWKLAKANLREARANLKRAKGLIAEKIISLSEYDRTHTDFEVKKAQASLAQAQWRNTQIISPIDGVILDKMSEVGEVVNPNLELQAGKETGVYKIADLSHLQVEVDISESEVGNVYLGQGAVVTVDAVGGKTYQARVEEIAPLANRQKGTVQAKVKILNPDEKLKPEMSAKITFLAEKEVSAENLSRQILVPAGSIHQEGSPHVFLFQDGKVILREVELGEAKGQEIVVKKGLQEGDILIVNSSKPIQDGSSVKVREL